MEILPHRFSAHSTVALSLSVALFCCWSVCLVFIYTRLHRYRFHFPASLSDGSRHFRRHPFECCDTIVPHVRDASHRKRAHRIRPYSKVHRLHVHTQHMMVMVIFIPMLRRLLHPLSSHSWYDVSDGSSAALLLRLDARVFLFSRHVRLAASIHTLHT